MAGKVHKGRWHESLLQSENYSKNHRHHKLFQILTTKVERISHTKFRHFTTAKSHGIYARIPFFGLITKFAAVCKFVLVDVAIFPTSRVEMLSDAECVAFSILETESFAEHLQKALMLNFNVFVAFQREIDGSIVKLHNFSHSGLTSICITDKTRETL